MNYKIIKYICNCSYVFIINPKKRILKKHFECPEHKRLKTQIILFCKICDKKIVKNNLRAAARQQYCNECGTTRRIEQNREGWQGKYKNRYRKNARVQESETQGERDRRQVNEWAEDCRKLFPLSVVEAPILNLWEATK